MEQLKSSSSKWIKTKGKQYKNFYWQDGYGAFSVSTWQVKVVRNYIPNQKEYHNKKTFKQEYRTFLKKYNLIYDERYI